MFIPRRVLFLILLAIVVVAAVGYWLWRPPAGAFRFSIDRPVIKQGENATITVTVKNLDLKRQTVEYRFNVSHWVEIHEGAEKLLPRIGPEYMFNYTIEATDPEKTKAFLVIGRLEEGISSATYPISLTISFDGEDLPKTWNDIILEVER